MFDFHHFHIKHSNQIFSIDILFLYYVNVSFTYTSWAAVAEEVEWSSSNLKILNPQSSQKILSKMLNPELCLIELLIDALYECVCDWVNVNCTVKSFEWSSGLEKLNKYKSIYHC